MQFLFARADLFVAEAGEKIADPGGDERVRVEHLDQVFFGDRDGLDEFGAGVIERRFPRDIAAAEKHQERYDERADQQHAHGTNGVSDGRRQGQPAAPSRRRRRGGCRVRTGTLERERGVRQHHTPSKPAHYSPGAKHG